VACRQVAIRIAGTGDGAVPRDTSRYIRAEVVRRPRRVSRAGRGRAERNQSYLLRVVAPCVNQGFVLSMMLAPREHRLDSVQGADSFDHHSMVWSGVDERTSGAASFRTSYSGRRLGGAARSEYLSARKVSFVADHGLSVVEEVTSEAAQQSALALFTVSTASFPIAKTY
jgi:hypothetical protein